MWGNICDGKVGDFRVGVENVWWVLLKFQPNEGFLVRPGDFKSPVAKTGTQTRSRNQPESPADEWHSNSSPHLTPRPSALIQPLHSIFPPGFLK